MWPPRDADWAYKVIHLLITLARPLFCRLRIEGRDLVPRSGGFVLTCNHTMGPDFLVVGYATPHQVYFMAKQELFEVHPLLTWLFRRTGVFPIRRGETDLTAVNHAIGLVKSGHVLGMFPEGTRSRTGQLQRGRSGAAHIAIQAQAPVVPAYVRNAEPIFQRRNWLSLKPRARVTVRFGAPLPPPRPGDARGLRQYTRQIMQAISELAGELTQGTADASTDASTDASAAVSANDGVDGSANGRANVTLDSAAIDNPAEENSTTEQNITVRE